MLKIGEKLFKYRDYTPIPFVIVTLFYAAADRNSLLIGSISMILGECIRLIGVSYIGGVSRTKTYSTGQKLINGGPFSFVRNPLYLGNLFLSTGIIILANVNIFFVLAFVVFFFCQYIPIVLWEESNLKQIFGTEFEEYMQKVPRWIPALRPKTRSDNKVSPEFLASIRSEKNTLFAAIVLYLLILWRSGYFDGLVSAITAQL
jgi:protein-S-isoprenylcysteine O-methyltransferase Ste14